MVPSVPVPISFPRRYLVLGAAGGLGTVLSERLAKADARLWLAGSDEARLRALADRTGAESSAIDARRPEAVVALVARAADHLGGLDGVVSLDVVATNLGSAFHLVRAAARVMRRGGGSIVLVSSTTTRAARASREAVAAARAGVEGLTRNAAASYAEHGIRVNCVAPGRVETPTNTRPIGGPGARTPSGALHPHGPIGQPEDVASVIEWLLDPGDSWVTGQVVGVDGGLATLRGPAR